VKALESLVPALKVEDLAPDQSGIRAQLLDREGKWVDNSSPLPANRQIISRFKRRLTGYDLRVELC